MPASAAKQAEASAAHALEIAAAAEPKVRGALMAALMNYRDSVSVERIRAYVISGDLQGLSAYLLGKLGAQVAGITVALDNAVKAAGVLATEDINAYLASAGKTVATQLPLAAPGIPAQIVFQGVSDSFSYNPSNTATIQAVRQWQGALIQQMADSQRQKILGQIREGMLAGENPRTIAIRIRDGLPLTVNQANHVQNFSSDLDRIVANGMRSAQSWGIYTPRQIAELRASDPAFYKRLNFTAAEKVQGRRWGKISRASGTLAYDPKLGLKPSKPIGFVNPPGTQGGDSAWRRTPDGKLVDNMTSWRLRDKRLDPLIYDVVEAQERLRDAELANGAARTAAEKDAAQRALQKAQAADIDARARLGAEKMTLVDRYRERYIKHRSQVIARTESLRAANLGSYQAWRQAMDDSDLFEPEEVRRIWITAKDDRVRDDHRNAAGQKVGIHDPFRVGGEAVMFPPHQPNCRCTVGYAIDLGATA